MIRHVSIPATGTRYVAEALQRLLGGVITPFGPYPDSWTLWAEDGYGTAVEIYPVGTEMVPPDGPGQAQFRAAEGASPFVATHVAMSVNRPVEEIEELAAELGWRAVRLSRGDFEVVEFWIENHVMVELLTPEMSRDYLAAARSALASGSVGSQPG
jgi:hypothetical protein